MKNIETIRRRVQGAEDLLSVVKTMKGLAAVNVRHFERAVESLSEYSRTVELGLQIVLSAQEGGRVGGGRISEDRRGVVIFGSDQGMCGQFNERIVDYALQAQESDTDRIPAVSLLTVGSRVAALSLDAGQEVEMILDAPGGVAGMEPLVQELLFHIEGWRNQDDIDQVLVYHNHPVGTAGYGQNSVQLLPVDLEWLRSLERQRWPSRGLPTFTMEWDQLFAALIRQQMFVVLFRACAESLAAENAARVAAMQNAESNIEDRLAELEWEYHRQRQNQIDAELLDIVSGFDAVMNPA